MPRSDLDGALREFIHRYRKSGLRFLSLLGMRGVCGADRAMTSQRQVFRMLPIKCVNGRPRVFRRQLSVRSLNVHLKIIEARCGDFAVAHHAEAVSGNAHVINRGILRRVIHTRHGIPPSKTGQGDYIRRGVRKRRKNLWELRILNRFMLPMMIMHRKVAGGKVSGVS